MPVHGPPDPISAYHGREEALKTSWVNSNYPAVPSPLPALGVPFFSSAKVDPNGQVGLNPDGTWQFSKLYNWDTWKSPFIEYIHVHQFAIDGQVRIAWRAMGGDLFRTGWIIKINYAGNYATGKGTSGDLVRYGGEFNPSGNDKERWSLFVGRDDRNVQVADTDAAFWSVNTFGGYADDIASPNGNILTDPTTGEHYPSAMFSCVMNANPGDEIAVAIIPVDGRQYHNIDNIETPSSYDTTNNPNSGVDYENYLEGRLKKASYHDTYQLFDAKMSNGVVKIFGGMGGVGAEDISNTQASLVPTNLYSFYLRGLQIYHWVYIIRADNPDVDEPYYPDSAGLPTDHYYATSDSDDYTTFGLGRWVRFEGAKMFVDGLSSGVEYKVFATMFYESDINRYSGTPTFSAPESARGFVQTTFMTTTTALDPIVQTSFVLITPVVEPDYNLEWNYDDADASYEFQFRVLNDDGSLYQDWQGPQIIENKENWGTTTNPKKATVTANLLLNPGQTIEWKMRATSSTQEPSPWTDPVTYTA